MLFRLWWRKRVPVALTNPLAVFSRNACRSYFAFEPVWKVIEAFESGAPVGCPLALTCAEANVGVPTRQQMSTDSYRPGTWQRVTLDGRIPELLRLLRIC